MGGSFSVDESILTSEDVDRDLSENQLSDWKGFQLPRDAQI
ncbi:hypothetical protein PC121_g12432, partial [Phytophthora cactorum]